MMHCSYNAGNGVFTASLPNRKNIMDIAKKFTVEHVNEIKIFLDIFQDVFGNMRNNYYAKPIFIIPLFNIYHLNKETFSDDELKERFKQCISHTKIIDMLRGHSRENKLILREYIMKALNEGQEPKFKGAISKAKTLTKKEKKFLRIWNKHSNPGELTDAAIAKKLNWTSIEAWEKRVNLENLGFIEKIRRNDLRDQEGFNAKEKKFLKYWESNKKFKDIIIETYKKPKKQGEDGSFLPGISKAAEIMKETRFATLETRDSLLKKGLIKIGEE